jgi:hypothetical protein
MAGVPSVMAEQHFFAGIHQIASVSLTKTAEANDVLSFFRWLCKFGAVEESFRNLGKPSYERVHAVGLATRSPHGASSLAPSGSDEARPSAEC